MRLFISYAHADRAAVEELAHILERGGFEPWYDYELIPGEVWRERLAQAIAGCEAFVYALTPESVASEYCQWEFEKALALNKPVMPVLLKAGTEDLPTFPAVLRDRQWADLTHGPDGEPTALLLNGLYRMQALLNASPPPASTGKSAEFIAPGAMEASMSKQDDKPRISISQKADHSSNVTQIGYVKGSVNVTSGGVSESLAPELQRLYDRLDQWVAAQRDRTGQEDAAAMTTNLKNNLREGNETGFRQVLFMLKGMAPDIWEVVVATLANPITGVAAVIQKVAAKAKADAAQ